MKLDDNEDEIKGERKKEMAKERNILCEELLIIIILNVVVQNVIVSGGARFQRFAVRLDAVYAVPRLQASGVTAVVLDTTTSLTARVSEPTTPNSVFTVLMKCIWIILPNWVKVRSQSTFYTFIL